jgi:hypothetical protein
MDPNLFRIAHQTNFGLLIASAIEAERFRSGAAMALVRPAGHDPARRVPGGSPRGRRWRRRVRAALGVN